MKTKANMEAMHTEIDKYLVIFQFLWFQGDCEA